MFLEECCHDSDVYVKRAFLFVSSELSWQWNPYKGSLFFLSIIVTRVLSAPH